MITVRMIIWVCSACGSARIWRVERYRAVKIVRRDGHHGVQGFETEFQGLQRYEPISRSHEGLVHVLQIGRNNHGGFFYYVMEVADDQATGREINPNIYAARTLKGEIANRGCIPVEECLRIGLSLSAAIAHIHKHGLIHRDIKPANVVFVDGVPKLADIGLIANVGRVTYAGTPGFIPKEGPGNPPR